MAAFTVSMNALTVQTSKLSFGSAVAGRVVRATPAAPKVAAAAPLVVEAKYKLKTCKAAAKRYRVTGSGKVMRRPAGKAHLLAKKRPHRKHRLEGEEALSEGEYNNVMGQLPHAGIRKPGNQNKSAAAQ